MEDGLENILSVSQAAPLKKSAETGSSPTIKQLSKDLKETAMKPQRIYLTLITGAVFSVLLLFAHGLVFFGFALALATLALAAYLYGPDGPRPTFSKEEKLVEWEVKWELESPAPTEHDAASSTKLKPQPRGFGGAA